MAAARRTRRRLEVAGEAGCSDGVDGATEGGGGGGDEGVTTLAFFFVFEHFDRFKIVFNEDKECSS